jgi:cephalosporin-C deacetylase-like acetyl esterase
VAAFAPATGPLNIKTYGALPRSGYRIEKLTYESEPGTLIPALIYLPESRAAKSPAILWADGQGKQASREAAELLVRKGNIVMSIDARGLGETRPALDTHDHFVTYFGDYENAETAILLGKTLVGMRAADIARGIELLSARSDVDASNISCVGKGVAAVAMLHAAAFDPRIKKLVLEDMLVSYDAIVRHRIHRQMFEQIVPSALKFYDLPDLVESMAPRPVWLIDAVNPLGQVLPPAEVHAVYGRAQIHVTRGEGFSRPVNPVLDEIFK